MDSEEKLDQQIRKIPLEERLKKCLRIIGKLCKEHRCPKMTIPVQWDDEDIFMSTTIKDALKELQNEK